MNSNLLWRINGLLVLGTLASCQHELPPQLDPQLITNSIGMKLASIPAGESLMGTASPHPLTDASQPRHPVTISKPFYMGVYEVTQQQLKEVLGYTSSKFQIGETLGQYVEGLDTSQFPVDHSTWGTARLFCETLSNRPQEIAAGRVYRLPTEAEWEYACRAGTETLYAFGDQLTPREANINAPQDENANEQLHGRPTTVGSYASNAFGLYDMHGNVWEWCQRGMRQYGSSPETDPQGPISMYHVIRGGAWDFPAQFARSDYRTDALREYFFAGFRVVCEIKK